jgi:mono/diheme cytochrome c family protein
MESRLASVLRLLRTCSLLGLGSLGLGAAFAEPSSASPTPKPAEHPALPGKHRDFLTRYCTECHGAEKQKGKLRLDDIPFTLDSPERAERWAKILNSLNSGEMPPDDAKQPEKPEKADFLEALSQTMVAARRALTDQGGKITMRRLNRREYQNTLRELLGVNLDVGTLPPDGGSDTFDTVGASLFMSPDQFQLYRELGKKALTLSFKAATTETAVQKAHFEAEAETIPMIERQVAEFVSIRKRHTQWTRQVDAAARKPENAKIAAELREKHKGHTEKFYLEWEKIPGAPSPKEFGFPDAIDANMMNGRWDTYVPQAADYLTLPKAKSGTYLGVAHLNHRWVSLPVPQSWPPGEYKVRARIAAPPEGPVERRFVDFLTDHPSNQVVSTHQVTGTMENPQLLEFTCKVDAESGRRFKFSEKAVSGNGDGKGPANDIFREGFEANRIGPEYAVWIDWVEVEGPIQSPQIAGTLANVRSQIERFEKKETDARQVLSAFASKALRGRDVTPEFLDKLVAIYESRTKEGDKPLDAIKEPLALLLSSPSFLYLAEPATEGAPRQLTERELATRLSFFLWSSPPDAELLDLANRGELRKPEVLSKQVDRLLADERSERFTRAFVAQWLGLSRLDFFQFNSRLYRDYDLPTKAASKNEVFVTFHTLLQKRASLSKLLKSDSVFINGLLAQYYKIPGVIGDAFREVTLPADSPRGGLLGMAAILAMGSNGEQTSPVERGAWVLRKLLHDPPPPAPANVPQLNRLAGKPLTTRERIALHQEEPQCAQCHRKIDPIGFGLENFDAAGRWRTEDLRPDVPQNNRQINASGAFHKGESFRDYFQLRDLIAAKPERLARGFTEALVEFALGRPFGFSDEDLASEIMDRASKKNLEIAEFIHALADSKPFHSK